jgi:hypothetical protein
MLELPQKYRDMEKAINDWHYDKKIFPSARGELRDAICSFVFSTINWQQEGIPLELKFIVETSSHTLVAIERQERALEKGLLILEDNDENYILLGCFNRWLNLGKKSWDYGEYSGIRTSMFAASDIFFVTSWLERHKQSFVKTIKEYSETKIPDYIKCAILLDVLAKAFNEEIPVKKIADITMDSLISAPTEKKDLLGHSTSWKNVQDSQLLMRICILNQITHVCLIHTLS